MNSCDDYERIRKRIEEERKKYQICYVQGPTGPRGEKGDRGIPGPSSIDVGITETVEPFEVAKVENSGTNEDVILNFKIPRGQQGVEGKIGPQGIPGLHLGRHDRSCRRDTQRAWPENRAAPDCGTGSAGVWRCKCLEHDGHGQPDRG